MIFVKVTDKNMLALFMGHGVRGGMA